MLLMAISHQYENDTHARSLDECRHYMDNKNSMKKTLIFALAIITFSACYNVSAAYEVNTTMEASPAKVSEVIDECIEYAGVDEVPEEAVVDYLFTCVNDILTISGFSKITVLPVIDNLHIIFSAAD